MRSLWRGLRAGMGVERGGGVEKKWKNCFKNLEK